MVAHRLSCFSYIFLLANSTCWLPIHFFTGQLNVLAYLFFYRPTQRVGLSLSLFFTGQLNMLAFLSIARWMSSALVTRFPTCSESTSWGADHWQQQETWRRPIPRACMHSQAKNLINLVRPVPSWRPFTKLFIFSSQWQYCLPNQVSNLEIFRLDLLVVRTGNFSFIFLDLFQRPKS